MLSRVYYNGCGLYGKAVISFSGLTFKNSRLKSYLPKANHLVNYRLNSVLSTLELRALVIEVGASFNISVE